MLRITVELLPFGDATKAKVLGVCHLVNDGSGTLTQGNYYARFSRTGARGWWKTGEVKGFPRKRLGQWDLLYRALRSIVGDRNEPQTKS